MYITSDNQILRPPLFPRRRSEFVAEHPRLDPKNSLESTQALLDADGQIWELDRQEIEIPNEQDTRVTQHLIRYRWLARFSTLDLLKQKLLDPDIDQRKISLTSDESFLLTTSWRELRGQDKTMLSKQLSEIINNTSQVLKTKTTAPQKLRCLAEFLEKKSLFGSENLVPDTFVRRASNET